MSSGKIKSHTSRRMALKGLVAVPVVAAAGPVLAAVRTPSATEGPFYPTHFMRFNDADNDLVKIKGLGVEAVGDVVVLKGRVLDRAGKPVAGARVEIWQCDANGRYLHTGDQGGPKRDKGFQGFGYVVTGVDGAYAFRTIKPVPYPGRTPHIHVKVKHGRRTLITQLYIKGHPLNARDFLFRRMSRPQQQAVSMVFEGGQKVPEATIDIRV